MNQDTAATANDALAGDSLAGETLHGKLAVVTGASSGIGRALALALAAKGARVLLLGRDEARLRAVAEAAGGGRSYAFDLGDDAAVAAFARALADEALEPDILVHSAGIVTLGRVLEASLDALDRQYRINLRAPFALTQALLPGLIGKRGQIVFVNSGAGLSAKAQWGQYAATKHALKALADSLREEVAGEGVRVLSVYPGRTASPMQAAVHRQEGAAYDAARLIQPQDVASVVIGALELPLSAAVTDVSVRPHARR